MSVNAITSPSSIVSGATTGGGGGGAGVVGYQRTFVNADLVAGDLAVTFPWTETAPLIAVYDNAGALVQPQLATGPSYTWVVDPGGASGVLSINPVLLPIAGTWTLTLASHEATSPTGAQLFIAANVYNAATAINASAGEFLEIDLAAIAAGVVVTFPPTATVGQCIGLLLITDDAGVDGVDGAGPVDGSAFPFTRAEDCALWTWDGTTWQLVSRSKAEKFQSSAPFVANSGATTSSLAFATISGAGHGAPAGEVFMIDAVCNVSLAGFATTVNFRLQVDGVTIRAGNISMAIGATAQISFSERHTLATGGAHTIDFQWAVGNVLATATNNFSTFRLMTLLDG